MAVFDEETDQLERDSDSKCVYWFDIWQDCEDGVANQATRGRSHAGLVDIEAVDSKPLCHCIAKSSRCMLSGEV